MKTKNPGTNLMYRVYRCGKGNIIKSKERRLKEEQPTQLSRLELRMRIWNAACFVFSSHSLQHVMVYKDLVRGMLGVLLAQPATGNGL